MLSAVARRNGCAVILSADMQDGRRLSGVEFVNPLAAAAAGAPRLAALRAID